MFPRFPPLGFFPLGPTPWWPIFWALRFGPWVPRPVHGKVYGNRPWLFLPRPSRQVWKMEWWLQWPSALVRKVGKLRRGGLGLLGSSHDLGVVVDSVVLAACNYWGLGPGPTTSWNDLPSGDGDSRGWSGWKSWRHCLELGSRLGLSENSARDFTSWTPPFQSNVPISWRLIAFMNYPYLIMEISWSSGSLLSDRWWTNEQVCSGSVPFRFSKFERGWTNYLRQHMRQHAVLVFLGASLPWCGMGWMVFGHMNYKQIEKRSIIYAYVFFTGAPPNSICINEKYIYVWSLIQKKELKASAGSWFPCVEESSNFQVFIINWQAKRRKIAKVSSSISKHLWVRSTRLALVTPDERR